MSVVGTILIGLIVGLLARFVMPGSGPQGLIITILLGIGGAFVTTFVGQTLGWYQAGETAGFIGALIGAMVLVFLYREVVRRQ
jgi:uncharacterized membrane protein YeaQ/YmgE (transglycosylase-associated protein family)